MSRIKRFICGTSSKTQEHDEESAPLINKDDTVSPTPDSNSYLGSNPNEKNQSREHKASEKVSRIAYLRRFALFVPYIWPSNNRWLQANLIGIVFCLALLRVLKLLAPYQLGIVIKLLGTSSSRFPLWPILLYLLFNWVDSAGLVETVKAFLWLPVEQNAQKSLYMAAFNRVMMLSSDFHDNKKSGELYKSISQGASIHTLFEQLLFDVLPMIFDIVVACLYLSFLFGWYMSLVVCTVCVAYVAVAKYFTEKNIPILTAHTEAVRAESQVLYDIVGSWISVVYFNNFGYEENRYSKTLTKFFSSSRKINYLYAVGKLSKDSLMEIGYGGACLLAAYQVFRGSIGVGKFVILLNYWARFTTPLMFFGYLQRNVQQNFIEAEQLLKLLETEPTVKNGKAEFRLGQGAVDFKGVNFSYDGTKPIIKDLNFSVFPGQKVALVGETGCGKSTILQLIFRLYDVGTGSVQIDGQNIRDVTFESLRSCIGVVPQNPVLFNDTVRDNVRYSNLDATDEQVVEACKAAAIHDKILTFTDGYASIVGENGVKLSGGEVQRVAIARVILMDPKIILLDEATSAVDSHTEAQIQAALRKLTHGRTTFCVAHRLSTVMDADVMLVIKDGRIVEQGSPKELLNVGGEFSHLCSLQNITTG